MSRLAGTVAVIVTFNSENTIELLIDSLLQQTVQLKKIVVVDNASHDCTVQILLNYNNELIELMQLSNNQGGAGGFRAGLEYALMFNPSFILTMDDDAIPTNECFLEKMLDFISKYKLDTASPIVLDDKNLEYTAYQYKVGNMRTSSVQEIIQSKQHLDDIKLFNGTFFSNNVIARLRGPDPKFFIRGDEEEFKQRILSASYKVGVCKYAYVTHPSSVSEYYHYRKKRFHHCDDGFKLYFSTRNRIHMIIYHSDFSTLKKVKRLFREFFDYSLFYLVYRKFDIKRYSLWVKAYLAGFKSPDKLVFDRY